MNSTGISAGQKIPVEYIPLEFGVPLVFEYAKEQARARGARAKRKRKRTKSEEEEEQEHYKSVEGAL